MDNYNIKFSNKYNKKTIFFFFLFLLLIACSNDNDTEDVSVKINNINASYSSNRSPRESEYQVDIELLGIVDQSNIDQNIQFEWGIKYLKSDVLDYALINNSDETGDSLKNNKKYLSGYYFLDVSKNPLNALLSVYKQGYYKITLQGTSSKETKDHTIILKIGEVNIPELLIKVNIPDIEKSTKNDFKGNFYISINDKINDSKITKIDSGDLMDKWYNTHIKIDPFSPFSINAGSYVIKLKTPVIGSISQNSDSKNNDQITYTINSQDAKKIFTSPVVLNRLKNNSDFIISKQLDKEWQNGELFISFLSWGYGKDNKDEFNYFEKILNNNNRSISTIFENVYLSKIFVGSFGHRVIPNKYFVYFGPEGSDAEELDPNNQRDLTSLPYGYLLGKLDDEGLIFPIGSKYSYFYDNKITIYTLDSSNNFVPVN